MKNYPGSKGKSGHLQQIVSLIPQCKTFIEAMAGSAVISNYMIDLVDLIVINDYDSSLNHPSQLHYIDLVAKYDYSDPRNTVFYFDPPYLMETRSWKGKLYNIDWNKKDHQEFIAMSTVVKSNCMISHYPCSMYDTAFKKWRKHYYKAMTRAGVRTECVYMNFPPPTHLACCSVVGNNHTHRQQIKRKLQRLITKIQSLPIAEQQAIITTISKQYVSHSQ